MEWLFPDRGPAGLDAYDDLRLVELAAGCAALAPARPYVVANMVATVDGAARIGETTRRLGNQTDAALLVALRDQVDCVMAGTGTIAAERYGPLSRGARSPARRAAAGVRERPLFATVTRSGALPFDIPLFASVASEVVVFATGEPLAPPTGVLATMHFEPIIEPRAVAERLYDRWSVRALLIEGGPRLLAAFIRAGVVDEIFLALDPQLVGLDLAAQAPLTILGGPIGEPAGLTLRSIMRDGDLLFLRYAVNAS